MMEQVDCIICKRDESSPFFVKNGYTLVKCRGCGLVYLNPRLDKEELNSLYNKANHNTAIEDSPIAHAHDQHKIRKFQLAIDRVSKSRQSLGQVFDLGCSSGIFLDLVEQRGGVAFGSDVNQDLIRRNRERFGDRIVLQKGETIPFPDHTFDVVTLFDSIEHLPTPITTLKEVIRVLNDDGLLVVTTPNINGLFPRFTYKLLGKTIGAWDHPTPPGHVFQFSLQTLTRVLEDSGFVPVDNTTFAFFPAYTIGELENSIINALRPAPTPGDPKPLTVQQTGSRHSTNDTSAAKGRTTSFFHRLPRLLVHLFSASLVALIYPLARLSNQGDTLVVLARKKTCIKAGCRE